jgi:prolyl 4-hydroxylase
MPIQPLGNRQAIYDEFLDGCVKKFGSKGQKCVMNEHERIAMSLRQPQSMTNYTEIGFKKIKAPEELYRAIKEFWDANKDSKSPEQWGVGNTYTNNWLSPTYMVSVENGRLRGGGAQFKQKLWNLAQDTIQVWYQRLISASVLQSHSNIVVHQSHRNGRVKNSPSARCMEFEFTRRVPCLPLT